MPKKYARMSIGDRYHVKGFIPPVALQNIAEERTWGLQGAFVASGAKASHVALLARSCYMQGVNYAIDSLKISGVTLVPKESSVESVGKRINAEAGKHENA